MTSNKRNACEQALPEGQHGEEKTSDALLDVLIETDTKPFIYDVDENPPLFMTICFAMQVRIIIVLITLCLNPLKTRNPQSKAGTLAIIEDPDKMPHYAAFHQDLYGLLRQKSIFR